MVVTSIIVTTIIVFILVDILLRMFLQRVRTAQTRKEREQALVIGLKLDVSKEAPTLTRVELDSPKARILAVDDEKIILDSLRKDASRFQPYSEDPDAPVIDEDLAADLQKTKATIDRHERNLEKYEYEEKQIFERFNVDVQRFKALKGIQEPPQAALARP